MMISGIEIVRPAEVLVLPYSLGPPGPVLPVLAVPRVLMVLIVPRVLRELTVPTGLRTVARAGGCSVCRACWIG